MRKVYYNINNRWDNGDSLVNISTVVESSQESHDFGRERFKLGRQVKVVLKKLRRH